MVTALSLFGFAPDAACVAQQWLHSLKVERRLAPHTLEAYARDLSQFGQFLAQHRESAIDTSVLSQLVVADFRSFLAARRRDEVQNRSLARQISALRSFFRFAERQGLFHNKAVAALRAPKIAHAIPRALSVEAACAVTDFEQASCKAGVSPPLDWEASRDQAVLLLLYAGGLRISEALSLTPQALQHNPLRVTGKGQKTRLVPLLPVVTAAIASYQAACPFPLKPDQPLFRGVKGGVLSPRIIQLLMARLRGALGLSERTTPHALRHSFASHLLGNGADLRVIQELLGHASLSSTQVYTEVNRTHLLTQYRKAFAAA